MTAKIIPFPGLSGPNLAEVEAKIRYTLAELTGDSDLVEHVTGRMMVFIQKCTCKTFEPAFDLPTPPMTPEQRKMFLLALEAGVDGIAEQVYAMVNNIVKERLLLEIEIYQATYGEKSFAVLGRVPGILDSLPNERRERIDYLLNQLKKPDLTPQEKYLLNKLLASLLEEHLAPRSAKSPERVPL